MILWQVCKTFGSNASTFYFVWCRKWKNAQQALQELKELTLNFPDKETEKEQQILTVEPKKVVGLVWH